MTLLATSWVAATRFLHFTLHLDPQPATAPAFTITSTDPTHILTATGTNPGSSGTFLVTVMVSGTATPATLPVSIAALGYTTITASVDLASAGSLDTGFTPAPNRAVLGSAVQADGRILVIGSFWYVGLTYRVGIARLNADGTIDTTFDPSEGIGGSGSEIANALAVQDDGKIIVAGDFTTVDQKPRNRIARLNADGTLDTVFNAGPVWNNTIGPDATVLDLAVQSDGKVIITGTFTTFGTTAGTTARNHIARLNADGTLDATFNAGTPGHPVNGLSDGYGTALAIQSDGKIIVTGTFAFIGFASRNRIARLNSDGTLDTTFDPGNGLDNVAQTVALQADGKIIVGGYFTAVDGTARSSLAVLPREVVNAG